MDRGTIAHLAGRGTDADVVLRRARWACSTAAAARGSGRRRDRRHCGEAGLAGAAGDRSLRTGADGGGDRRGPRDYRAGAPRRRGAQTASPARDMKISAACAERCRHRRVRRAAASRRNQPAETASRPGAGRRAGRDRQADRRSRALRRRACRSRCGAASGSELVAATGGKRS